MPSLLREFEEVASFAAKKYRTMLHNAARDGNFQTGEVPRNLEQVQNAMQNLPEI